MECTDTKTRAASADPVVVLDCRWLSFSGAGRVTETLLRGLRAAPPPERWILWGPPEAAEHLWPGAQHVVTATRPTELAGQRDWFAIPKADLVVFLHQQRPLRGVPALTTILDTTPLRFNRNRLDGWAKALYLRRAARSSKAVLTISDYSRSCIERDLGVPRERITKLGLPADRAQAERVLAMRRNLPQEEVVLYVGLFLPHKNLPRLVEAFGRTSFRKQGGRLVLVGGKEAAATFRTTLDADKRRYATVQGQCSQDELERLYATSRLLVQPSLEEGFGLPVQEALASGLEVCTSTGGALPEAARGMAEHFEPTSVTEMASAIDRSARLGENRADHGHALSAAFLALTPTIHDLACQVVGVVQRELR